MRPSLRRFAHSQKLYLIVLHKLLAPSFLGYPRPPSDYRIESRAAFPEMARGAHCFPVASSGRDMDLRSEKLDGPSGASVAGGMGPTPGQARQLDLPEEVSTQQAAAILGCCKHTVLHYMEAGLLEWRNAAPPSSARPVFRFTLRSVLDIRLGYKTGSPSPNAEAKLKPRQRKAVPSGYQIKHLRRQAPAGHK